MKTNTLLLSYIGFCLIYLLIILLGMEDVAWFLKPFLLPFLLFGVYFHHDFPSKKFLLTALTFSWIGDIILLFAERGELFFISGLIAFLISHLVYILLFNKQLKDRNKKNKAVYWIGVTVIIAYLFVMLTILLPSLGDLQLPVLVYAIVLSTMLLFAFKGFLSWKEPANSYVLLGAIIFVSSDSILAFDKFHEPIAMSSFLIMVTYLTAQFLIVKGILKLNQKK
ncbi:lysoplasmalogenase [Flavobacterium acetivorans]|uniref:lysoplasmalogenase n=1 Tax=Flavobacterium acetivorans TaxID=2893883 RepID=UPI001E40F195|nr:lysoplasmalogenase [Flavobacterium sp. F-29]UFH35169.1 lysoplasmalogenase [Flavobacterium sp. F-29]